MPGSRKLPDAYISKTYDSGGGKDYAAAQDAEQASDITLNPITTLSAEAVSGQKIVNLVDATPLDDGKGFEAGDTLMFDPGGGNEELGTVASRNANEITLVDNLTNTQANGEEAAAGFVLRIYKGAHDDNDRLDDAGTDANYFRVFAPASGEGHLDIDPGVPAVDGSMAAFAGTNDGPLLRLDEDYSQFHDLVGKLTITSGTGRIIFGGFNTGTVIADCIAFDGTNAGVGNLNGILVRGGALAVNCLSLNNKNKGIYTEASSGTAYNCSSINNGDEGFFEAAATTLTLKNCLGDNNTGGDYANTPTMTTCGSSDGSGSAGLQNQNYTFVNAGGDDFHYTSGSDGIGDGTDLSGDGTYAFDDDIDGDTRSSWDIGFDEFVAAVTANIIANTINYNGLGRMFFRAGRA